jgi:hypothetical protein
MSPLLSEVCRALEHRLPPVEVSMANIGAASAHGLHPELEGNSADAALFVAWLSRVLELPVRQDAVFTGHLGSPGGELRMVACLPAKLEAAINDPRVTVFVYPDADASLMDLSPKYAGAVHEALTQARERITLCPVQDIGELLGIAAADADLVVAGLRQHYFDTFQELPTSGDAISRTLTLLAGDMDRRFWSCLQEACLSGDFQHPRQLLHARAAYHRARQSYPHGLGLTLYQFLQGLPPAQRRRCTAVPPLDPEDCLGLVRYAAVTDFNDVLRLFQAVSGERSHGAPTIIETAPVEYSGKDNASEVDLLLRRLGSDGIATEVTKAIDEARLCYTCATARASSAEGFYDAVTSFYIHMMRHLGRLGPAVNRQAAAAKALRWVEEAFSRHGGTKAARAEALQPVRGGLRYVFDVLTAHEKWQEEQDHKKLLLDESLEMRSHKEQVRFLQTLLQRLPPHLRASLDAAPPERFVPEARRLLLTYVQSLEPVQDLLRAL